MAAFLSASLKATDEVDLSKPLLKYIENTFTQVKKEECTQAVSEFNKLRQQVVNKMGDRHESALDILFRYHDQLAVVETKLPITENQIRVNFTWYDAYDKGSIFGRKKCSMSSAAFERLAVQYQIAVVQSQLAADQNNSSDDGLKNAAKFFQSSSGLFNHLKEITSTYVADPTTDMSRDMLSTLSHVMHAQAQDCFARKARRDKMKDGIIAKVANYAAELYHEAQKDAGMASQKNFWPKDWLPHLSCRYEAYLALTQYYQAQHCGANNQYGEQVARLKKAKEHMAEAKKASGNGPFAFAKEQAFIDEELVKAEKDNKLIYHDKIPAAGELAPVGKAYIAKPTPPPERFSSNFKDLFAQILPAVVHNAMTMFENQKSTIVNMEIGRMREATQLMNGVLSSLNLPASIEDLGGGALPQSVIEKSEKLRASGGAQSVQQLMGELPELLSRNKEILDECTRLLDDEQSSDQQLRQQFGQRWTRKPSEELTVPIRQEGAKYKSILDAATQSDHVVKAKYEKLAEGIALLGKTPSELNACLPAGSSAGSQQDSAPVRRLRELMREVDKIKAEREELEQSLKDQSFDIAGKFLSAMAADGIVGEESICSEELEKIYGPLRSEVSATLQQQEQLLASIQEANTEFSQAKQGDRSSAERERLLKEMAEAYDGYMELKANLEEGTKFYNDLTQLLVKFQSKIRDFCFARKTEKDDLMKDLQQAIANKPTEGAKPYKAQPPARPPPPQQQISPRGPKRPAPPPPSEGAPPAAQAPPGAPYSGMPPVGAASYPSPVPPAGAPPAHQPPTNPGYPQHGATAPGMPYQPMHAQPYPYAPYVPQSMPQSYNPYGAYGGGYPGAPYGAPPPGAPQYGAYPQYPGQYPQQQPYPGQPQYPQQQQWR